MHLRTRLKPFYCSLRGQGEEGDISSLSMSHQGRTSLGRNSCQACDWWVGHITTIPSQSPEQALLSHEGSKRTVKQPGLKTQAGPLPLLLTQSQQTALSWSCTSRCGATTPQCSNTARSSVVINLFSHVHQTRVVSVFRWLLFSFWTDEIKILQAENILQYDTVWFTLPETHLPIIKITRIVQNIFHIRRTASQLEEVGTNQDKRS